jgi:hypothetical protein
MRRYVSVLSLSIPAIGVRKECCSGAVKIVRQEQVHLVEGVSSKKTSVALQEVQLSQPTVVVGFIR